MRPLSHWTPRYVRDRTRRYLHELANPTLPWLPRDAVSALETMLRPTDTGIEFGSGRSTLWLAARVLRLTSVEHDRLWFEAVSDQLRGHTVRNADCRFVDASEADPASEDRYVDYVSRLQAQTLDFIVVDGIFRRGCAEAGIAKLKPGGLMIIDDAERYIRHATSVSPNARKLRDGSASDLLWMDPGETLLSWRHLWTSDGVTDAAIFIKPAETQP